MFFDNPFDNDEFERGFNEAREHAYDVKDALRYIQKCNAESTTYGAHIHALKAELLDEGYITETETEFVLTPEGEQYMNSPGVPSLGYLMHRGL